MRHTIGKLKRRWGERLFRAAWGTGLALALAWAALVLGATAYSFIVISAGTIGGNILSLVFESHPVTIALIGAGLAATAVRVGVKRRRLAGYSISRAKERLPR